jgi:hypothetical protein
MSNTSPISAVFSFLSAGVVVESEGEAFTWRRPVRREGNQK